MRRIVTAITAAALSLSLVSQAMPANAAAGFDSAYAGESAFLTLSPGASGTFTVFFANTGTNSWTKGTATQVDLAACLEDKTTCDQQDASEAPFNSGWLSATRYATHTQTTVAPGSIGTFTYNVTVAKTQAGGTYRFNGALVVSTSGADVHNEGYFQDVTVPTTVASCTPTKITTDPTTASRQVGTTHTQSATADCDAPAGSTTRPKAANAQVTVVVDAPLGSLNADLTLTATTNADGLAQVTWTRSNPDADTVAVYPTAAPQVRATATIIWQVAANPIVITPDTSATAEITSCRAYTITTQSTTTGAAASRRVLLNFTENSPTVSTGTAETSQGDKGAFIKIPSNGARQGGANDPTNVVYISLTTDSTGTGTFDVCGPGGATEFTVTPVGYLDSITNNGTREAGEDIQDTGGAVSFQVKRATITLTPDTTATAAAGGGRLYTVTAVDQFGAAFTDTLDISFSEITDDSTTTTSSAVITFTQVGGTAPTAAGTCVGAAPLTDGVAATGTPTTDQAAGIQRVELTFGTSSTIWFAICSVTNNDTGTPVGWQDISSNDNVRQTSEPQDTGGTVTWKTAASTTAGLTPTSATNIASSGETTPTNNGSIGEERYTAQVNDQSGNQVKPSTTATTTVVFTVKNTSSSGIVTITECRLSDLTAGAISGDATLDAAESQSCTVTIPADSLVTAQVEIDKGGSGSATVNCTMTINTATPSTLVCTQATKTWVSRGTEEPAGEASAVGNVVAFDKTLDHYAITTTLGNFTINYDVGEGATSFQVDGSTAAYGQFETNLTIGDKIEWSQTAGGAETHKLTNQ